MFRWKGPKKISAVAEDSTEVEITALELYDQSGDKIIFELLDTIKYEGGIYGILKYCPYVEDRHGKSDAPNVFIFKHIINPATNEPLLEPLDDEELIKNIFDIFNQQNGGD